MLMKKSVLVPVLLSAYSALASEKDSCSYETISFAQPEKAYFKNVLRRAESGNTSDMFAIADELENGSLKHRDVECATQWYLRASRHGHQKSQIRLSTHYRVVSGIARDSIQAAKWYKNAANSGLPQAQYQFGHMLEVGQGIAQDTTLAIQFFEKAAKQLDLDALYTLGLKHELGQDIPIDYEKAAHYYREAARYGVNGARLRLANLYETGLLGQIDIPKALEWYRKGDEGPGTHGRFAIQRICKTHESLCHL